MLRSLDPPLSAAAGRVVRGLRRLGKPAWLLNNNGQDHVLAPYALKRDYAVRMQQFFDHYLRGAPPAVWMVEGIPALRKGRELGLDLVQELTAEAFER